MSSPLTRRVAPFLTLSLLSLFGGCSLETANDKAGGDTVVLRLATIDGEVNPNDQAFGPEAFVDQLTRVSGGRIKVEVRTEYGDGAADGETKLIRAISSGRVDGGWPATRAFAEAGIPGFQAIETPLTLTSYDAEKALARSDAAVALMRKTDGTGLVGLGLSVGSLRRPFAARSPLVDPDDWQGVHFRTYNSPVQAETIRALGGRPENVGLDWLDKVRHGSLRGAEYDLAQYAHNGGGTIAGNITSNVVLWPKMYVLSLSEDRWGSLTYQQRAWVRLAARRAVATSIARTYDDRSAATRLCSSGARFSAASETQLRTLRSRLEQVVHRIATNPAEADTWREVQKVARDHPAVEGVPAPPDCDGRASSQPVGQVPSRTSELPDGVYRVANTEADVARAGLDNSGGITGTWTLRVADGTFQLSCRPLESPGTDCGHEVFDGPLEAGRLRGAGNQAFFAYDPHLLSRLSGCTLPVSQSRPGACFDGGNYRMAWSIDGTSVTFSDFRGSPDAVYIVQPWRKIS